MPFDGRNYAPPRVDALVGKMDELIAFLGDERNWCKQQLRSYDGRRCILGGIMKVAGANSGYTIQELKEPIMDAIKQVTGRDYLRIEMFNDHPRTTHSDVVKVLHTAKSLIQTGKYTTEPKLPFITTERKQAKRWWQLAKSA